MKHSYEPGTRGRNLVGGIFSLKNQGWSDRQEIAAAFVVGDAAGWAETLAKEGVHWEARRQTRVVGYSQPYSRIQKGGAPEDSALTEFGV